METNPENPTNAQTPDNNNGGKKAITLLSIILGVLVILSGIFLTKWLNAKTELEKSQNELALSNDEMAVTEAQLEELNTRFSELQIENENLNAVNEEQQAEIQKEIEKVRRLLRYEKDYKTAKSKINSLNAQIDGFMAQIEELKEENEKLSSENQVLTSNLDEERKNNQELSDAKVMLAAQNDELNSKNSSLSSTVEFASVVAVNNIEVTGYKAKDKGKNAKKKYAKNVELLDICFQTTVNEVARGGSEDFYIRLISPIGETLYMENMGSGTLKSKRNNETIRYTKATSYDYSMDVAKICLQWSPNTSFSKGNYEVEVYNKGYLCGTGNFTLK